MAGDHAPSISTRMEITKSRYLFVCKPILEGFLVAFGGLRAFQVRCPSMMPV